MPGSELNQQDRPSGSFALQAEGAGAGPKTSATAPLYSALSPGVLALRYASLRPLRSLRIESNGWLHAPIAWGRWLWCRFQLPELLDSCFSCALPYLSFAATALHMHGAMCWHICDGSRSDGLRFCAPAGTISFIYAVGFSAIAAWDSQLADDANSLFMACTKVGDEGPGATSTVLGCGAKDEPAAHIYVVFRASASHMHSHSGHHLHHAGQADAVWGLHGRGRWWHVPRSLPKGGTSHPVGTPSDALGVGGKIRALCSLMDIVRSCILDSGA